MSQPPAFQLYAADFYMDTISWSNEDLGIYFRLLMCEWINGPLPFEAKELAKMCQIVDRKWAKKWHKRWSIVGQKFTLNGDGKLINKRLEKVREEQLIYRESQSESGKRGVKAKKKRGIFPFKKSSAPSSDPCKRPFKPKSSSSSLSSSLKDKEQQIDYSQLQNKTDKICKMLSGHFKDFNFYAWRQEQVNKQKHPEGIEECLTLIWKSRKTVKKVRPYLTQLMKIKGPNAFERIAMATHEKRKKEESSYNGSIGSILKRMD